MLSNKLEMFICVPYLRGTCNSPFQLQKIECSKYISIDFVLIEKDLNNFNINNIRNICQYIDKLRKLVTDGILGGKA